MAVQGSPTAGATYTLEQAASDIAALRGQIDAINEAHIILDSGFAPNLTPSSGVTLFSQAGDLHYEGFDGNEYSTGHVTIVSTAATTISSTSPAIIGSPTPFSVPVAIGTYHWRAHVMYIGNGTGTADSAAFRMGSPAFSAGSVQLVGTANGPLVSVRFDNTSGFGSSLAAPIIPATASPRFDVVLEGAAVFTAAGNLIVQAALNAAGTAQFVIAIGSSFTVWPVD
jgi:hypothetical protein